MNRRKVKPVSIGKGIVFGSDTIYVQSMLNCPSGDVDANVAQAKQLEAAGCDIIRVAIPDHDAIRLIDAIKQQVKVPLVADIHFDYRLALESVAAGVDKVRINPGNIGGQQRIKQVAKACNQAGVAIRVGVNSGSVEKELLEKHSGPTPCAMVESALKSVELLNRYDFNDIVLSIKSSDVRATIEAYELLANECDCPLHLGVTEAGTEHMGQIKSAIGIGSLLAHGIGDTIRVSLTGDPVQEVQAGKDILKALGLCKDQLTLVCCPTCGRTRIDLISLAHQVEQAVADIHKPIKVAVMGCAVNGPGEARDADIGIAGGDGCAVLFRHGEIIKKVKEQEILAELLKEIEQL